LEDNDGLTCPNCHSTDPFHAGNAVTEEWTLIGCYKCGCVWNQARRKPDPLAEAMAEVLIEIEPMAHEVFGVCLADAVFDVMRAYRERSAKHGQA
jgi:hypothetical protein